MSQYEHVLRDADSNQRIERGLITAVSRELRGRDDDEHVIVTVSPGISSGLGAKEINAFGVKGSHEAMDKLSNDWVGGMGNLIHDGSDGSDYTGVQSLCLRFSLR